MRQSCSSKAPIKRKAAKKKQRAQMSEARTVLGKGEAEEDGKCNSSVSIIRSTPRSKHNTIPKSEDSRILE